MLESYGFVPATLQSLVRCANHKITMAPIGVKIRLIRESAHSPDRLVIVKKKFVWHPYCLSSAGGDHLVCRRLLEASILIKELHQPQSSSVSLDICSFVFVSEQAQHCVSLSLAARLQAVARKGDCLCSSVCRDGHSGWSLVNGDKTAITEPTRPTTAVRMQCPRSPYHPPPLAVPGGCITQMHRAHMLQTNRWGGARSVKGATEQSRGAVCGRSPEQAAGDPVQEGQGSESLCRDCGDGLYHELSAHALASKMASNMLELCTPISALKSTCHPEAQPIRNLPQRAAANQTHKDPRSCEPTGVDEMSMDQRRNERAGKREIPEKTCRPTTSSGTFPHAKIRSDLAGYRTRIALVGDPEKTCRPERASRAKILVSPPVIEPDSLRFKMRTPGKKESSRHRVVNYTECETTAHATNMASLASNMVQRRSPISARQTTGTPRSKEQPRHWGLILGAGRGYVRSGFCRRNSLNTRPQQPHAGASTDNEDPCSTTAPPRTVCGRLGGRGLAAARPLVSHKGETGSIPGGVAPEFSRVEIAVDYAAGLCVISGISRFLRPCIPDASIKEWMASRRREWNRHIDECEKREKPLSPTGSPDFRKRESCHTMLLVGRFSTGSPVSPDPSFRGRSIFTSITLIGSQDLPMRVIEVSMEQRRNERAREMEDHEVNPLTSGIETPAAVILQENKAKLRAEKYVRRKREGRRQGGIWSVFAQPRDWKVDGKQRLELNKHFDMQKQSHAAASTSSIDTVMPPPYISVGTSHLIVEPASGAGYPLSCDCKSYNLLKRRGNGRSLRNPADQRQHQARFLHAKIREAIPPQSSTNCVEHAPRLLHYRSTIGRSFRDRSGVIRGYEPKVASPSTPEVGVVLPSSSDEAPVVAESQSSSTSMDATAPSTSSDGTSTAVQPSNVGCATFACEKSKSKFGRRRDNLKRHLETCTGLPSLPSVHYLSTLHRRCTEMTNTGESSKQKTSAVNAIGSSLLSSRLPCSYCDKTFANADEARRHKNKDIESYNDEHAREAFKTSNGHIYNAHNIEECVENSIEKVYLEEEEMVTKGSGWTLDLMSDRFTIDLTKSASCLTRESGAGKCAGQWAGLSPLKDDPRDMCVTE
ncbi:hypothetical protein PR048_018856 [Dryococelus australis]|uniref:C2H2-type domain-containing protein n=1 Tax=Dryococelus australis TaxID=614101 RepID=A0ABQ9H1T6_9NEOP|nr:hypothetical protein PR048_018856 [Dryococelus australis]